MVLSFKYDFYMVEIVLNHTVLIMTRKGNMYQSKALHILKCWHNTVPDGGNVMSVTFWVFFTSMPIAWDESSPEEMFHIW